MTVGQAYTSCKLRVDSGEVPDPGAFLVTAGGSAYRVEEVRGRTLHVTRWPLEEVPADGDVWQWWWSRR